MNDEDDLVQAQKWAALHDDGQSRSLDRPEDAGLDLVGDADRRLKGSVSSSLVAVLTGFSGRHPRLVLISSWIVAAVSAVLSAQLTLDGGFSALLPSSTESVRHLHALERRVDSKGSYMIGVQAASPSVRAAAVADFVSRAAGLDRKLVSDVVLSDKPARDFVWNQRWLLAALSDLEAARDSLETRLAHASPFDLALEDNETQSDTSGAEALRIRLAEAKREAGAPGTFISKDGRLQLVLLRTTFSSGDVERGRALTRGLLQAGAEISRAHPGAEIGLAGDIVTTLAEHDALLRGMLISTFATGILVLAALLLFYRSVLAVGALAWALSVGVLATFAFTRLTIGHLNIASAFLSSIVVGNGINAGLLLLARYSEERQPRQDSAESILRAAQASAPGTLAATLGATVAYGSLALTSFRGFRDFGIIGATGMIFCWLSAYTVLPAGLALVGARFGARSPRGLGKLLEHWIPERPRTVSIVGLLVMALTATSAARYLTQSPFENDLRNLRSRSAGLDEASRWMDKFDKAFGHGLDGGFAIGVERRSDAALVAAKLRQVDAGKPERRRVFSSIHTLDDWLPADQSKKLAVLAEIRGLLDSPILRRLTPEERRSLSELRPPDTLGPIHDEDLPSEIAQPFVERDGTRGRLVLANTGLAVDGWRISSLVSFAHEVRRLALGPGVLIGGSAFVFSDMLEAMERDGPRAVLAAVLGSCLVIFGLFRRSLRAGGVTLLCAGLGTAGLLSAAWALGIRVNFLDFIALPITIGIGIDYAVNIAARAREVSGPHAGRTALMTTGPVVILCSYTTVVGYASLLFSQNQGIRSFGLSAMVGELTCLSAATLLAPALLDWPRRGSRNTT